MHLANSTTTTCSMCGNMRWVEYHQTSLKGKRPTNKKCCPPDPPSSTDWVLRALGILHAEGLNPNRQDVTLMLQSFDGSARDLIDLIEETVIASKAAAQ